MCIQACNDQQKIFLAYGLAKSIFEDVPHIEHLTKENFDTVLNSDHVWLVEFFDAK